MNLVLPIGTSEEAQKICECIVKLGFKFDSIDGEIIRFKSYYTTAEVSPDGKVTWKQIQRKHHRE